MLNDESFDIQKAKIEELKRLFPEVVTESGIDFDALKATLGGDIDNAKEKYRFTWNGKSELFSLINRKTKGALKPDVAKSGGEKAFESAENIIIEADNLEAIKLLMSAYHRRVKMIYIDPPYNKQKDFVYPDNWSDPLESYLMQTGQKDEFGLTSSYQDKTGRLHTNWLNMIYPRLYLARNLLRDDGVIFVSIDDDEVHNLRKVMDEIFGEENFVAVFPWRKRTAKSDVPFGVSQDYEWAICYAKEKFLAGISHERKYYRTDDFPNDGWRLSDLTKQTSAEERPNSAFDMIDPKTGKSYSFNPKRTWAVSKDTFQDYYDKGKIVFPDDYEFLNISIPAYRVFESEDKAKALKKYGSEDAIKAVSTDFPKNIGMSEDGNKEIVELFGAKIFSFPKPSTLVQYFVEFATSGDDIILDFFAGSGTTAHAVMAQNLEDGGNRRYILVQMPEYTPENSEARKAGFETIADVTAERVRRAAAKLGYENGFRYFRLDRSHFRVFEQMQFEKGKTKEEVLRILRLSMFHDNTLMANWTPIGVAYETGLKNGMALTSEYKTEQKGGYTLHSLRDGTRVFVFCFDPLVKEEIAKLLPVGAKFVCLDKSLTDSVKLNIVAQIGLENVETI